MQRILFIVLILLAGVEISQAQVRATTESGNRVLLFEDGTWKYDETSIAAIEKTSTVALAVQDSNIEIDSSRVFATEQEELFYLPSERLVKYFGENGGAIRCKLSCSNGLGEVKIHFAWEFPVSDGDRYFALPKEGANMIFTMWDGKTAEIFIGDDYSIKRFESRNYSLISFSSLPLDMSQITALRAQPFRKMEVGWKKKSETYDVESSNLLMNLLPQVF